MLCNCRHCPFLKPSVTPNSHLSTHNHPRQPLIDVPSLCICLLRVLRVSGLVRCVVFNAGFPSWGIIFEVPPTPLQRMSVLCSFLWLSNIPLCEWTCCVCPSSAVDTWVGSTFSAGGLFAF